jgi:hypothetical protein
MKSIKKGRREEDEFSHNVFSHCRTRKLGTAVVEAKSVSGNHELIKGVPCLMAQKIDVERAFVNDKEVMLQKEG